MKKFISVLFLLIIFATPMFADTVKLPDFEPYGPTEFPQWSQKLRRGESLFFGSLALTMPVAMLGYNIAGSTGLIEPSNNSTTNFLYQLSIATTLSLSIAIGDYIIGEMGT